jgi:hypothetical protein
MTRESSEATSIRPDAPAPRDGAAPAEQRRKDRRSGIDRRFFPRPEGRRASDGRRADDEG